MESENLTTTPAPAPNGSISVVPAQAQPENTQQPQTSADVVADIVLSKVTLDEERLTVGDAQRLTNKLNQAATLMAGEMDPSTGAVKPNLGGTSEYFKVWDEVTDELIRIMGDLPKDLDFKKYSWKQYKRLADEVAKMDPLGQSRSTKTK